MPVASPLTPKSALRHRPIAATGTTPPVLRASRTGETTGTPRFTEPAPHAQHKRAILRPRSQTGPLWLGGGMMLTLVVLLLGQLVLTGITTIWNDWHYGRPRTFQIDAVVGHGDSIAHPSHFIALNLRGRIEIIELPAGDPTRARIYSGPQLYGSGADLVPVTLQFSGPTRTPDMVILFQGTQVIFHNVQGTFRSS